MNDMVSKSDVLDIYVELYDIFDDNKAIQKILDEIYDKINNLKEQEPVKPKRDNTGILCGQCRQWIGTNDRFCSNCGREVKWG